MGNKTSYCMDNLKYFRTSDCEPSMSSGDYGLLIIRGEV